ncbi:MAG: type IV pilus twitching motility protein PilT [Planctomycetota bacterium]
MNDVVLCWFQAMVREQASDLILRAGHRPAIRVEGKVRFLAEEIFSDEQADRLLEQILSPEEIAEFRVAQEKDTAIVVPDVGRFRTNILRQRRQVAFVFRYVKDVVPGMEELHLPAGALQRLSMMQRGLVLVTGIAGSGKSTTLASMIDHINRSTQRHIVTIEDPIEFVFRDDKSAITQREIGIDTADYHTALKAVVRQTPDVILVGEMRDLETVQAALSAAETGHLVLATLHTVNAVQTVERIISFFPPYQHGTVRLQLGLVLEGVVSQRLITRRATAGRVPAVEVLLGTPTVKEMILEGRTRELPEALEDGQAYYGTQTFNQSLVGLVREGLIDYEDAIAAADSPDELKLALRGITKGVSTIEATYAETPGGGGSTAGSGFSGTSRFGS